MLRMCRFQYFHARLSRRFVAYHDRWLSQKNCKRYEDTKIFQNLFSKLCRGETPNDLSRLSSPTKELAEKIRDSYLKKEVRSFFEAVFEVYTLYPNVFTGYEKLFVSLPEGTEHEAYEKLAYNVRTRAFFEALRRGLLNNDELEKAAADLEGWLDRDRKKFAEEQRVDRKKR